MTTEDRVFEARLAEMLHRVTPEPPRTVTVEDVAIRLANQASAGRGPAGRGPAGRGLARLGSAGRSLAGPRGGGRGRNATGPGRGDGRRRWTPLLAAASVVVVAGASTGIVVALSGSSKPASGPADGVPATSSSQVSAPSTGAAVSSSPPVTGPPIAQYPPGKQPWGATPKLAQTINAATLTGGDGGLFGLSDSALVKLNPVTGDVENQVAYPSGFPNQPPVIAGHVVWLVWSYSAGGIALRGFSADSLAPAGNITVSGVGEPTGAPDGILAATPAGHLWVAAGNSAQLINPANGAVLRTIPTSGPASAVASSPDGAVLYVGIPAGSGLQVTQYDAASGAQQGSWTATGQPASNLVASPGGVWLATGGTASSEQLWFAPAGHLASARVVAASSTFGLNFLPTYADGVVWVGGPQAVKCLDPGTGSVRASAPVEPGNGAPGEFGDIAIGAGHALALYLSNGMQAGGATAVYPPAACFR